MKFKYTQKEFEAIGGNARCREMAEFFCGKRLAATPTKTLFEEWFKREILKARAKKVKKGESK